MTELGSNPFRSGPSDEDFEMAKDNLSLDIVKLVARRLGQLHMTKSAQQKLAAELDALIANRTAPERKRLNLKDVENEVLEISRLARTDPEAASGRERALWINVLNEVDTPAPASLPRLVLRHMAHAALYTLQIEFDRGW